MFHVILRGDSVSKFCAAAFMLGDRDRSDHNFACNVREQLRPSIEWILGVMKPCHSLTVGSENGAAGNIQTDCAVLNR